MPTTAADSFDYIVVGAGSAGCVLANRLSADPKNRVLLLEAGGRDNWVWFHIPAGYLFAVGNPRADWCLKTEPEAGLNGRTLSYPRGRTLGGSSAINGMIYMRGQAADYDHWRQLGLTGWGWDDVLPIFKSHEDHFLGASDLHGAGGEWRVEPQRLKWQLLDKVREAAEQEGIAQIADFNTGDNEGSSYFQVNQKRGFRWSAARGFLKPVQGRANLKVETGCQADRILIQNGRAVGIAYNQNGVAHTARARRDVILASGAIGSPQLLKLSGIGPGGELASSGIEVAVDRPGVGGNLQDHLQLRMIYKIQGLPTLNEQYHSLFGKAKMALEFALFQRGPLTMAPSQLGIFTRSRPDIERADLEFHVQPLSLPKFGEPLHPFPAFTMSVCNLRPTSRGSVTLTSSDPRAVPRIQPNYLSTHEDRMVAADSLRVARRIVAQPALAPHLPEEMLPGSHIGDSEEELARAAGEIGTTIFHPVGTAKMGIASDPLAVVDERLRVFGIDGLRVADASVMPTITSGNTHSPTLMIAEKASAMILQDAH